MNGPIPAELHIGGIYFPPALFVAILGFVVAMIVAILLNRARIARFFWNPPLVFVAMWLIASALIGMLMLAP